MPDAAYSDSTQPDVGIAGVALADARLMPSPPVSGPLIRAAGPGAGSTVAAARVVLVSFGSGADDAVRSGRAGGDEDGDEREGDGQPRPHATCSAAIRFAPA